MKRAVRRYGRIVGTDLAIEDDETVALVLSAEALLASAISMATAVPAGQ